LNRRFKFAIITKKIQLELPSGDFVKSIDRPLIIAAPPLIFFFCLIAGGVLHFLFKATLGGLPEILRTACGVTLALISGIVAVWSFIVLKQHNTPFNPYKATTSIVQRGPFRLTRNPMYLSLVLLMAATAFLANAFSFVIMILIFMITIDRGVIRPEEIYLEKKFGGEYTAYKTKVRRWL
jgi:protein-S-isoprenylcysteine O-methyltransferase Ste14